MSYVVKSSSFTDMEIAEAMSYITNELHNPQAAENHYQILENVFKTLADNPHIRPLVRDDYLADKGVRSILVKKYYLFYTINEGAEIVNLIRFIHSRRDWASIVAESV
jgi:plasmid stabilization system protein ParE